MQALTGASCCSPTALTSSFLRLHCKHLFLFRPHQGTQFRKTLLPPGWNLPEAGDAQLRALQRSLPDFHCLLQNEEKLMEGAQAKRPGHASAVQLPWSQ